ncbi:hypothetical protein GAYE_SCF61G6540 [Galdieria yellowstonensis]|uniref:FMR1-interacting protein 1 conserved domain-containing protein n=1 Tax=Galdieria yellowstonensis TaxID=3028027 RepID=A0AAV9IM24_9RHOD|nr:hypothetical protein GAYE_SCF61G6540 [Galdieria yellowstonensis]
MSSFLIKSPSTTTTTSLPTYSQWKPWGRKKRPRPEIKTPNVRHPPSRNSSNRNYQVKETPEEIARYIEERRKKWPTAKKIAQQQQQQQQSDNALQLVAQVYQDKDDVVTIETETTTPRCNESESNNTKRNQHRTKDRNTRRSDEVAVDSTYRPNLFTLFVQKHREKQDKLLLDFIRFLHSEKLFHT